MKGTLPLSGIPCATYEQFIAAMRIVLARSQRTELPDGGFVYAFKDRSGLCLSTFTDAGKEMRCATPFLAGDSRVKASSVAIEKTNECPFCDVYIADVIDDYGNSLFPLRFYPADIAVTRTIIESLPEPVFTITAFGHSVKVHADRETFLAAYPETATDVFGDTVRLLGPETLHLALMTSEGELETTADVFMTATVLSSKKRREGIQGLPHMQFLARTAHVTFNVILAGSAKPADLPKPGSVLEGVFTLTGILISGDNTATGAPLSS